MRNFIAAVCLSAMAGLTMAADALWIDVRSAGEYSMGHLPQALNIPYTDISSEIGAYANSKKQPIKLYCGSGRRAGIAKEVLEEMGYTSVSNEGGYEALIAND